jgi:hypothetical protein
MELAKRIKTHENLHIVFWLIKDSCWMLQLKWLGITMVIPTLVIAAIIVFVTRKTMDVYLNTAILFWICANSFWMYIEFFTNGEYKLLAAFPFALGFIFVGVYYYKTLMRKIIAS